jgi:hypothetical protein
MLVQGPCNSTKHKGDANSGTTQKGAKETDTREKKTQQGMPDDRWDQDARGQTTPQQQDPNEGKGPTGARDAACGEHHHVDY